MTTTFVVNVSALEDSMGSDLIAPGAGDGIAVVLGLAAGYAVLATLLLLAAVALALLGLSKRGLTVGALGCCCYGLAWSFLGATLASGIFQFMAVGMLVTCYCVFIRERRV